MGQTTTVQCDALVIGAGISGASIARELTRYQLDVCIIDRASDVASATSRANSGIVHAGFDAKHGTLKAHYNVEGSRMYPALAAELGFAYRNNGSLVLAFTDEECDSIAHLLENGTANGVEGLRIIDAEELRAIEPNVSPDARAALFAPTGAITNPYEATLAFAENAVTNGARLMLDTQVEGIERVEGEYPFAVSVRNVETGEAFCVEARCLINAAGIFADRVAAMAGDAAPHITARRGEYVILDKRCGGAFACTMFRAPSSVGKGVLVSPTADDNIIVGPNAHAVDRDAANGALDTTFEGIDEILTKAKDIWPGLRDSTVITRFAGLRATPDNGDFTVGESAEVPGLFNASGIESPGLTAAPAIAVDIAAAVAERLGAPERADFDGARSAREAFVAMDDESRAAHIAADPAWGRMVCRCEQVTEAEIREAVNAPVPATTVDAIKWRTRAGMGRCHGGFCSPHVARIIAEETGCTLEEVRKGNTGTRMIVEDGLYKTGCAGCGCSGEGKDSADKVPLEPQAMDVDVAVVGGGAAGIAAALAAKAAGIGNVLLIDREDELGGILKQCIHPGFGLERYTEELTGPEYAARDIADLEAAAIPVMRKTTVTSVTAADTEGARSYKVSAVGPDGLFDIAARSVVLATGSRERSQGQVDLNGDRPAGVYTAGCAQYFINLLGVLPGREVVIYGSGDIGLIMARRLAWEGVHVKAVIERGAKAKGLRRNVKQCLTDNDIPLLTNHSVRRVFGSGRVEGVEVIKTDAGKQPIPGTEFRIDCDTLLLSCGLIPEQDLLDEVGVKAVEWGASDTTWPGVFFAGNAAQIHDIVDNVTVEADYVGRCAAAYVLGQPAPEPLKVSAKVEGAPAVEMPEPTGDAEADAKALARAERAAARAAARAAQAAAVLDLPGSDELTCIRCPKGCSIAVACESALSEEDASAAAQVKPFEGYLIAGNECRIGRDYAIEEMTAPRRVLTSIVRCAGQVEPLSVRTDGTIPKEMVPQCLAALADVCVEGPLAVGDVVIANVCGTGADIVATKPLAGPVSA